MMVIWDRRALVFFFSILGGGCSSTSSSVTSPDSGATPGDDGGATSDAATSTDAAPPTNPLVTARPYHFKAPSGYDSSKPTPLLVMLHGYSVDSIWEDNYLHLSALAESKTMLYAYPDGTKDAKGNRFWNADDACCNVFGAKVDDVAYIAAVIDDVASKYNVDAKRVYVVGHSNGAFMAHRLACDLAPKIAAVVALAGDVWLDATRCAPTVPVAVAQIHGDADQTILYDGGTFAGLSPYPAAKDSVATWGAKDTCSGALTDTGTTLDLVSTVAGAETSVARFACSAGAAELWTMHGAGHIPALTPAFATAIGDFLSAHAKP
jgi:polyhydroxybutyrate depolymerase